MKNEWKSFLYGVITTVLVLTAAAAVCKYFQIHPLDRSIGADVSDKINVIDRFIENYYLDDVSKEDLEQGALKGMVEALNDKYSGYYTGDEYSSLMESVNGYYAGIGATVSLNKKKQIEIVGLSKESSAKKAGIRLKDIIQTVDGLSTKGKTLNEVISMVKGEEGTKVVFGLLRGKKTVTISVTRARITNISVDSKMLDNKIGYLQIVHFDDESPAQFLAAIEKLEKKDQKGMIIDLRDNGGGSLTAVISMLNTMLPKGHLLTVKEKGKNDEIYNSTDDKHFDKPCIILINGGSASASEVFAGAMQDRKAATLVGEQSFGKGIVQSIFSLENSLGGALKLTTAKYYLPSGRCIHKVGLTPDLKIIYTGNTKKYEESKDNQLSAAMKLMKSKIR